MSDQRCGTCKWWQTNSVTGARGNCTKTFSLNGLPFWAVYELEFNAGITMVNNGITCKTYEAKP